MMGWPFDSGDRGASRLLVRSLRAPLATGRARPMRGMKESWPATREAAKRPNRVVRKGGFVQLSPA